MPGTAGTKQLKRSVRRNGSYATTQTRTHDPGIDQNAALERMLDPASPRPTISWV